MEDPSHVVGQLASHASSWAVDAALVIVAISVGLAVVVGLGGALLGWFRDRMGSGATPGQVAKLLDRKINGGLVRIETAVKAIDGRLDALEADVAARHAENQREFGLLHGRLGAQWDGRERREAR